MSCVPYYTARNQQLKSRKREKKLKSEKKRISSEVSINSPGIRGVSLEEDKEGYRRWDGCTEKEGFKPN